MSPFAANDDVDPSAESNQLETRMFIITALAFAFSVLCLVGVLLPSKSKRHVTARPDRLARYIGPGTIADRVFGVVICLVGVVFISPMFLGFGLGAIIPAILGLAFFASGFPKVFGRRRNKLLNDSVRSHRKNMSETNLTTQFLRGLDAPEQRAESGKAYYLTRNEERFGPFGSKKLRQLADGGKIEGDDLITQEKTGKSSVAKDIPGLLPESANKLPAPPILETGENARQIKKSNLTTSAPNRQYNSVTDRFKKKRSPISKTRLMMIVLGIGAVGFVILCAFVVLNPLPDLIQASRDGQVARVTSMLDNGVNVNVRAYNVTAIGQAAHFGRTEVVEILLRHGAKVDSRQPTGRTPLYSAAYKGHHKIARMLIERGADVNATDITGNTPLHKAAEAGHVEIVKLLLDSGANRKAENISGDTPVARATNSAVRSAFTSYTQ